jgi:hypothetical protein
MSLFVSLQAVLVAVSVAALAGQPANALLTAEEPIVTIDIGCDDVSNECNITDRTSTLVFRCTSPSPPDTIVYWVLGEYQVVDLSEFTETGETGLAIAFERTLVDDGFANTYSDLNMTITGTARLFESFNSTNFTIHCISVFKSVNIMRSPDITFFDSAAGRPAPLAPTPTSTPSTPTPRPVLNCPIPDGNTATLIIVIIVCFIVGVVVAVAISGLLCWKCRGNEGSKM